MQDTDMNLDDVHPALIAFFHEHLATLKRETPDQDAFIKAVCLFTYDLATLTGSMVGSFFGGDGDVLGEVQDIIGEACDDTTDAMDALLEGKFGAGPLVPKKGTLERTALDMMLAKDGGGVTFLDFPPESGITEANIEQVMQNLRTGMFEAEDDHRVKADA